MFASKSGFRVSARSAVSFTDASATLRLPTAKKHEKQSRLNARSPAVSSSCTNSNPCNPRSSKTSNHPLTRLSREKDFLKAISEKHFKHRFDYSAFRRKFE